MKKVEVFTYSNPKNWTTHSQFPYMKNALHICATGNMQRGIKQCYGQHFTKIITVREVLTKFKPLQSWYNPEKRMQQYLKFAHFVTSYPFSSPTLKAAFKANKEDLLNTIRFLVQAGLSPQDLQVDKELTENERQLKSLWTQYETIDESLLAHRKLLKQKNFAKTFMEEFQVFDERKRIYLHGFYFITPEQQTFFKFLQNNGFELVFFQYYDSRFPNTFDFIRLFIDEDYGWSSDWQMEPAERLTATTANKFLTAYETRKSGKITSDLTINKYQTFFDFLQGVIIPHYPMNQPFEINKNVKIFAPNAEELNELVQMYYPALDKDKRKFLAHPIGRFLVNIHNIWQQNELVLTPELLVELFSSGWLIDEETQAQAIDYTYDLQQISPYFEGCRTIAEWEARIKQLAELKEQLLKTFPSKSKARKDVQLSHPFTKLSYFNVELERIAQIKDFLEGIRLLAEDLFNSSNGSSMNQHFSKLLIMLKRRKKMDIFTDSLELTLLNTLIDRLNTVSDATEFLYEDIQPALFLYLSGRFNENVDYQEDVITDFLELDGEIFKTQATPVYFTALDEQNLPLSEMPNPWPLQQATLDYLGEHHTAISLFNNRNSTVKETSRFLFFIALTFLNNETLQLSWLINRLANEGLNSTLYARQLNLTEQPYSPIRHQVEKNQLEMAHEARLTDSEKESFLQSVNTPQMLVEFTLCPKRFYYSFILQDYAAFDEDFMHEFIFSHVYRVTAGTFNRPVEETADELAPFFAHFKRFRLHATANDSHQYKYNFHSKKANLKDQLTVNHLLPGLTKRDRDALLMLTNEQTKTSILSNEQYFEAIPENHCKFCPHKNYCPDVKHSIDY